MFSHVFSIFHHRLTYFMELDSLPLIFGFGLAFLKLCCVGLTASSGSFLFFLRVFSLFSRFTQKSFSQIRSLVFEVVFNWFLKGRY